MQQDIIPQPINQRGSIRPPERPIIPAERQVGYRPLNKVSIDGIKERVSRDALVAQTAAITAQAVPAPPYAKYQPVSQPEATLAPQQIIHDVTPRPIATGMQPEQSFFERESETTGGVETVAPSEEKSPKKHFDMKRYGLIGLAVAVFITSAYVSLDTWLTNRQTQDVIAAISSGQESNSAASWTKEAEGKDETDVTADSLASYTVAPQLPRALYIDKLSVAARVMPMSVHKDGSVQAPLNIFDAGWYTGSMKPGEVGATFIDGHASGATREGLFAYLDTLVKGDTLQVEKGNGEKLTYKVVHTEKVPLNDVDMKKVLLPYGNTLRGLNLMTCAGTWVQDSDTYDHRVIVYTAQVE